MYSKEFVTLNIAYAQQAAIKTGFPLIETITTLTCIRRTVFGMGFDGDSSQGNLWQEFVSIPDRVAPVRTIMHMQTQIPPKVDKRRLSAGRLSATLPDGDGLSLIHFSQVKNEPNPLGEEGLLKRINEMAALLEFLKKYRPLNIGMFSWLLDGRFAKLFPTETEYVNNPKAFYQSLAVWGQYLRFNGSINQNRADKLMRNVNEANSLTDVQSAHPKKALEARVLAEKMFLMYGIK